MLRRADFPMLAKGVQAQETQTVDRRSERCERRSAMRVPGMSAQFLAVLIHAAPIGVSCSIQGVGTAQS